MEVSSYSKARAAVDRKLAEVGGYVELSELSHRDGMVSGASMTLRIPAEQLDGFIGLCSGLGTVLEESVKARDITEEYYDARARLENARKLEARLLELLNRDTKTVADLLEVEKELARVRESIETIEGRLRVFDQQVSMSKLVLELTTRDRFSATNPQSLSGEMASTLRESWSALRSTCRGLALTGVALLPWLPLLAGAGYGIHRLARARRKRAEARAMAWGAPPQDAIVPEMVPRQEPQAEQPQTQQAEQLQTQQTEQRPL